jgi:hypothetical protein
MANKSSDTLFQLIHSLQKAEKRHFKLYAKRNSSNSDLKIIQLFDALDKMADYNEALLLKRVPEIQKQQLSNLKAYLYKQILAALRLLKTHESLDLQLTEQIDYAHILYKKGLFKQALALIDKSKQIARANQKFTFLVPAIALEKRIESLHITRSSETRAEDLSKESLDISNHIHYTTVLSNLSLQLYSWYIKYGHSLKAEEEQTIIEFMKANVPADVWQQTGFYERLYLYQSYTWYHFIRQNFTLYFKYAQKWVDLFNEEPSRKRIETGHFIKGMHYLVNSHFVNHQINKSAQVLEDFEALAATERVQTNENFSIQAFLYISQGKINHYFMTGEFEKGVMLIPAMEDKLLEYAPIIDRHRVLVLNYKFATLLFGTGNYSAAIDYLQKIINDDSDLRYDLQSYARILHLFAHVELGNEELVKNLAKSVYRFMQQLKNMTVVEEELVKFLRNKVGLKGKELKKALEDLLAKIKAYEKNRFETRAFAYFDIISWLEARINNTTMSEVIKKKNQVEQEQSLQIKKQPKTVATRNR